MPPEYPAEALRQKLGGTVILEAVITREGTVSSTRVVYSKHRILGDASVEAVLRWRYKPALLNNEPVCVYLTVTTSFPPHERTPAPSAPAFAEEPSPVVLEEIEQRLDRGDGTSALLRIKPLMEAKSRNGRVRFLHARACLLTGDFESAEHAFGVAVLWEPRFREKRASAYASAARLIDADPAKRSQTPGAVAFLVAQAHKLGDPVPGEDGHWLDARSKKLEGDQRKGRAVVEKAERLMAAGNPAGAHGLLSAEMAAGSEDAGVHLTLGKALWLLEEPDAATKSMKIAVTIDPDLRPDRARACTYLARTLWADPAKQESRLEAIQRLWEQTLESGSQLSPADVDVWNQILPDLRKLQSKRRIALAFAKGGTDGVTRLVEKDIAASKWRRTMGDIRSLSTSFEAYAVDHNLYPLSGDLDRLAAELTPTYMRSLPRLDAWEHPFRVEISETRKDYRITSAGADGVFEKRPPLTATRWGSSATPNSGPGIGPSEDPGADVVYENGIFMRWWGEIPTPPGSESLVVRTPPER